jgi:hypothetical protein
MSGWVGQGSRVHFGHGRLGLLLQGVRALVGRTDFDVGVGSLRLATWLDRVVGNGVFGLAAGGDAVLAAAGCSVSGSPPTPFDIPGGNGKGCGASSSRVVSPTAATAVSNATSGWPAGQ